MEVGCSLPLVTEEPDCDQKWMEREDVQKRFALHHLLPIPHHRMLYAADVVLVFSYPLY
jgi:hypothetical protein